MRAQAPTQAGGHSLTIRYRDSGPHLTRWQVINTRTGTVLAQAQCLEAAHRHASSLERYTLHDGIQVVPA